MQTSSLSPSRPELETHISSILAELRLPGTDDDHRRVLAVVAFLEAN